MSEDNKEIKLHALDYWQVIRNRYGVILLAFFLVFMTATVITYMMPKEYLGRTTLQINRDAKDNVFADIASDKMLPYQTFMQTQFAIIESKENLIDVIKKEDLEKKWVTTELEAYNRLVRKMRAQDVRGTDLVQITVYDPDPNLAVDLANSIAEAYKNRREESERERSKLILEQMEMEEKAQKDLVETARNDMLTLMRTSNLIDISGETPKWMGGGLETGSGSIVMRSKTDEYEAKAAIEGLRNTIETMMNLDGDELIKAAVELGLNNPTLVNRYPEYESSLLQERALRDAGLGNKHPKVLQVRGTSTMLKKMLVDAVESTRRTLGTKMEIAEENLASVKLTKKDAEDVTLEEKEASVSYLAAKDDYELHKTLLSEMKQRIAISKVNEKMPRKSIEIHEQAEVSNSPAKPNVNLQLAIGADSRPDLRYRPRLLPRISRHLGEDARGRRALPAGAGARGDSEGRGRAAQAERHEPGCRGLPDSADQHRVQPQEPRGQRDHRGLRRCRRGQVDHPGQPRLHLRPGRLQHPDDRRRPAPSAAAHLLRHQQLGRSDQLPDHRPDAGGRDPADPGRQPLFHAVGHPAGRRRRHPQLAPDVRADRRREEPLRPRPDRLAADPRCQRRLGAGQRGAT